MDESRKQFEQYAADRLGLPLEMISDARNGDRYMHAFDSMSVMQPLNGWWSVWQASRAAIEIELPPTVDGSNVPFAGNAWNAYRSEAVNAICAAGIKIKE